jgi:hypothetical protein
MLQSRTVQDMTGQGRTRHVGAGEERTGQDRLGQSRAGQGRTGQRDTERQTQPRRLIETGRYRNRETERDTHTDEDADAPCMHA